MRRIAQVQRNQGQHGRCEPERQPKSGLLAKVEGFVQRIQCNRALAGLTANIAKQHSTVNDTPQIMRALAERMCFMCEYFGRLKLS